MDKCAFLPVLKREGELLLQSVIWMLHCDLHMRDILVIQASYSSIILIMNETGLKL